MLQSESLRACRKGCIGKGRRNRRQKKGLIKYDKIMRLEKDYEMEKLKKRKKAICVSCKRGFLANRCISLRQQ